MIVFYFFFFFKQKTAYEISSRDWSSDVCSSDLRIKFVATDLYAAGGTALVAKRLLEAGLLKGDAITVTGKTLAQEADAAKEKPKQEVVRDAKNPLKPTGGLVILRGNLAPEGCV